MRRFFIVFFSILTAALCITAVSPAAFAQINFSVDPEQPLSNSEVTLKVEDCPVAQKVRFAILNKNTALIDTRLFATEIRETPLADYKKVATVKVPWLLNAGTYHAWVTCPFSQYVKEVRFADAFTVTEASLFGEKTYPTQPPAPKPPCGVFLAGGGCGIAVTGIGLINTSGAGILYSMFVIFLSLSGGILLLTIIYSGYMLMFSRGNPEQIQKGKEVLTSAIIGFLFIVFSYVIFGVLTVDILRLPGFSNSMINIIFP
jgi:hypothetical protein